MTPTLMADHLSYRYGDALALDDISLTLSGPGIHGLLGRNGSGKTTLMSLASGLRRPSAGSISFNGQPIWENFGATSEICIIRETGDTTSEWSESLADGLALARDMRPYWDDGYASTLLERFELTPKQKVMQLSRGQRARFGCLLGLAARAPLTMFDETYLGMDAPARYDFYEALLADYMEHPRLIVISSHHIEEIARLFEQVIIIDQGKLLLHETADALRGRGLTLTGPATTVDSLAAGTTVLSEQSLGSTKSVSLLDAPADLGDRARAAGLETSLISLQDIVVHLTSKRGQP